MQVQKFEDLEVWKLARALSKEIFEISKNKVFEQDFKLRNQIRSSSGSTMDNIAEGFERGGNKEFVQFLYIAKGSCGETRSQVHRTFDYTFIDKDQYNLLISKCETLSIKLSNFIQYLKNSDLKGSKYH